MIQYKKGESKILLEQIIFIVLNVFFVVALLAFVFRVSSGAVIIEEVYAKQIALGIDSMGPGMEFSISLEEVYDRAEKNGFIGEVVLHEEDKNLITVKTGGGSGYKFYYFNDIGVRIILDNKNKVVSILS